MLILLIFILLGCCEIYYVLIKPDKNEGETNVSSIIGKMDDFLTNDGNFVRQIVYKIDGDYFGNLEGNNIIVILMNGDMNGNIKSKDGDVVLIKGNINGDVEANQIICQQPKSEYENYINKLSSVEKLSKPDKKETFKQLPPDYVCCADCAYAEDHSSNMYKCSKYDGLVLKNSVRICDSFKEK